ncbi:TetR/AcrR family transcriptional regulator [Actinomycetospora cinnamomea]|nr:TetR family transcriptional regulator [Actinomycetospora cinnamomea]
MARHVPLDERRPQLIDATIRVIAREGVARATTRRIAEEADASLASLHYGFANKEELFAAVAEHVVGRIDETLRARPAPEDRDLAGVVRDLLVFLHDEAVADPGLQAAQFELIAWARRTPTHHHLAEQCHALFARSLVATLGLATDAAGVPLAHLADLVMATTDGIAIRVLAGGPDVWAGTDFAALAAGLVAAAREYRPDGTGSAD